MKSRTGIVMQNICSNFLLTKIWNVKFLKTDLFI